MPIQSDRFGGGALGFPRPNILFISRRFITSQLTVFAFIFTKKLKIKGILVQKSPGSNGYHAQESDWFVEALVTNEALGAVLPPGGEWRYRSSDRKPFVPADIQYITPPVFVGSSLQGWRQDIIILPGFGQIQSSLYT